MQPVKVISFFTASLYLFGFSLNGVNFFGSLDYLIPFERVVCGFLSIVFFMFMVTSLVELVKRMCVK